MKQNNEGNWSLPWILGCLTLTVSAHWLIFRLFGAIRSQHFKRRLKDKVVLITGASSGLGEAMAHSFHDAGCHVILAARRKEELERVKKDLITKHKEGYTHEPAVLILDLSDLNSLPERASQALALFGHIDVLINNGGISNRGDVLSTNLDVFMKVMTINYFGQVALTKALLPSMVERRSGHIVSISSVQGKIAIPYRSAYSASKHAFEAFSDSLRAEVAEHNIEVSIISPGYVATALSINALTGSGDAHGEMDSNTANGYKPEYVAEEILKAVTHKKKDVILSPLTPRLAILIRTLVPSLYFKIMEKRALKRTE